MEVKSGMIKGTFKEMRINELETKINMELLKGGYSLEEIYG